MLKDLARALSLANLCFIASWAGLLDTTYNIPTFNQYFAIIIDVLLLATLFWVAITLARRSKGGVGLKLAQLVFPLTLLAPLNAVIRLLLPRPIPIFDRTLLPQQLPIIEILLIVVAIALIGVSDIRPWNRTIVRAAATVTLVLFPFSLITLFQASWSLTRFSDKPSAKVLPSRNTSAPRVLWLVFDELDQRIAFSERPATVSLPALDQLRTQAICASNAYPPADHTLLSMTSLITGTPISKAEPVNPSTIMITFAGSDEPVSLGSQPNIFSKAREAGFNTAVVGWYLPYCRVIGESLTSCSWQDFEGVTLRESMFQQLETFVDTVPLASILASRFGVKQSQQRRQQMSAYHGVLEGAKKAAINPDLGLILVHWPLPHPPGIYNRHKHDFELHAESSYLDNLELADRALGELRDAMEDAGMWDNTIVIVTSDHMWRAEMWRPTYMWTAEDEEALPSVTDHRVPFLLKLAGQQQGVEYDSEFNTTITHDLMLALLRGELSGADSVVSWLDRHR